jgi:hypothetical protein
LKQFSPHSYFTPPLGYSEVTAVTAVVEISGKVTELSSPTVLQSLGHLGLFIAYPPTGPAEEEQGRYHIFFPFANDYAQLFR